MVAQRTIKIRGQISSWSFSRYNVWRECAFKAACKFILKLPEPGSPALDNGSRVHKLADQFVFGKEARTPPLPGELVRFADYFYARREQARKTPDDVAGNDLTWAFRRDWTRTVYDDWNACWLRVKVDLAWRDDRDGVMTMTVDDNKTGRYRPEKEQEYLEQLELYVLAGLLLVGSRWPEVRVRARLLYLDQVDDAGAGLVHELPRDFTMVDLAQLKRSWEARVKPMLADRVFRPTPGDHCRYCHYRKAKGGPCTF